MRAQLKIDAYTSTELGKDGVPNAAVLRSAERGITSPYEASAGGVSRS